MLVGWLDAWLAVPRCGASRAVQSDWPSAAKKKTKSSLKSNPVAQTSVDRQRCGNSGPRRESAGAPLENKDKVKSRPTPVNAYWQEFVFHPLQNTLKKNIICRSDLMHHEWPQGCKSRLDSKREMFVWRKKNQNIARTRSNSASEDLRRRTYPSEDSTVRIETWCLLKRVHFAVGNLIF